MCAHLKIPPQELVNKAKIKILIYVCALGHISKEK